MSEKECDFIPMYSKESNEKGEQRICGKIYKNDIPENGEVIIYCYTKNKKLWYTSNKEEYDNIINQNQ